MSDITPNAATSVTSWKFQNSYIERLMDHSALTAAHPSDTLVMAGPPRFMQQNNDTTASLFDKMLPIGMLQEVHFAQQLGVTPGDAIGSSRTFYLIDKAHSNGRLARVFMKGRNLLRAMHTNAVQAGLDVTKFDDRAAIKKNSGFFANLDSELFRIPVGLAILIKDKLHNNIAACMLESLQITNWTLGIVAGQAMMMESIDFMFDRLMVIDGLDNAPTYQGDKDQIFKTIYNGADPANTEIPGLEEK